MLLNELLTEDDYEASRDFWRDLQPHLRPFAKGPARTPEFSSGPPPEAEFRRAERWMLQDPEWLAYWAKFGWTSWVDVPRDQWDVDPRTLLFHFRNVPSLGRMPEGRIFPDRTSVYFNLDGSRGDPRPAEYDDAYVALPAALDTCRSLIRRKQKMLRHALPFLKGRYFVRFGRWPEGERSQNFLASRLAGRPVFEDGVSAYDATFDLATGRWDIQTVDDDAVMGTMQELIYGSRDIFLIQGDVLPGGGADGEPLLHHVRLIRRLDKRDIVVTGVFDPEHD